MGYFPGPADQSFFDATLVTNARRIYLPGFVDDDACRHILRRAPGIERALLEARLNRLFYFGAGPRTT